MKILQLGKFYPIRGGVEKVMWDLTRGLSARDVDCDMLCAMLRSDGFDESEQPLVEPGEEKTVRAVIRFNEHGRCICVPALCKLAATMMSPAMIFWLRRHAREYDIIHVHHPDPMACLALWMSGYRGRVVLHWHSDILKQRGLLTLYRPLQRWLVRRADLVRGTTPAYVAQSPDLQCCQDKVGYLPIGIEDNMRKDVQNTEYGKVTVYSLGRLVEYKGYRYLIEAARYLPERYRIVIAGKGPLQDELQAQIDALPDPGRVQLLGYVSDAQARELYNGCDLFVLSSVMKTEAFGIVQIEAMSCGRPVVATNIPGSGTSWVNEHGVSGLNVPICDPRALADAIMGICEDRERYRQYCRDARARYESLFTYDRMIDGALDIYGELV